MLLIYISNSRRISTRLQASQGTALDIPGTALSTLNPSRTINKGKEHAVDTDMAGALESDLTSIEDSPGPESEEDAPRPIDKGKGRAVDHDMLAAEEDPSPESDEDTP